MPIRYSSHYMHDTRADHPYSSPPLPHKPLRIFAPHSPQMQEIAKENGTGDFSHSDPDLTVRKAAALLANMPSLFFGFCDPCSLLLRTHLSDIASGISATCNTSANCQHGSRGSYHGKDEVVKLDEHEPIHEERIPQAGEADVNEEPASVEEVTTTPVSKALSVAERERIRLLGVRRNKDFVCLERVDGKLTNISAGLELHTGIFSMKEQIRLIDLVRELQQKGRRQELKERTYSEPRKWMRGKGRVTIQFGCCYNYALDKHGNPPGIMREDVVDPLPPLLRNTIKRLVRWHVLPRTCVPDSCIINIYEEGDCIPPHIDHHDFVRPFCTLSLLSECNIVFGANLKIVGPGEFDGKLSIPLPVGSVLVLNGNGANVAKHAVPAVPSERISITFRKMDPTKVPQGFSMDNELQSLRPVLLPSPIPKDE